MIRSPVGITAVGRLRSILAAVLVAALGQLARADDPTGCAFCRGVAPRSEILVVAHAGASSLAPQNTLAAGRAALAAGADVWGVDVRRTQDGAFVLMHDETLDRTTDVESLFPARAPWRVADFPLAEILTLDAGSWFAVEDPYDQIAQGNVSPSELASYEGEPVPTLHQALEFVADNEWLMDIEVKAPLAVSVETVVTELVLLIRDTGTAGRVLVSSFDHEILHEVRRLAPEIPIGVLAILPPPNALQTLQRLGADVYLPSVVGLTAALLAQLDALGIHVILWTYNTVQQLEFAAGFPGVDGIYTDFPQRLALWLRERSP